MDKPGGPGDHGSTPVAVLERLRDAMNAHDLEAFVACFALDYRSEQPAHPDRAFRGQEQVRANWGRVFAEVPDFRADVVATSVEDDGVWTEWFWHGVRRDDSPFAMRGVTVFGVAAGRITWGRLFLEPVERGGAGIDEAVRRMVAAPPPD